MVIFIKAKVIANPPFACKGLDRALRFINAFDEEGLVIDLKFFSDKADGLSGSDIGGKDKDYNEKGGLDF